MVDGAGSGVDDHSLVVKGSSVVDHSVALDVCSVVIAGASLVDQALVVDASSVGVNQLEEEEEDEDEGVDHTLELSGVCVAEVVDSAVLVGDQVDEVVISLVVTSATGLVVDSVVLVGDQVEEVVT